MSMICIISQLILEWVHRLQSFSHEYMVLEKIEILNLASNLLSSKVANSVPTDLRSFGFFLLSEKILHSLAFWVALNSFNESLLYFISI